MVKSRYRWAGSFALFLLAGLVLPAPADLFSYVKRPEAVYRWELTDQKPNVMGTVYDLHLVSQVWQGITWEHRLQIAVPNNPKYPDTAILLITGGGGSDQETQLALLLANATGMPMAILYHIPNQPLFDGKREDALIAYTFAKYLQTGDDTWPLLFPMTKSAVKAMDALQEFSQQAWDKPLKHFVVTGASKRGWTTWLTGAVDSRAKAIMPMVIDNLNLAAQMPHQIETWGKYSEMIDDYTRRGLQELLTTEAGQQLGAAIDPYTYRDRITMPKLLINGTNDRYWTLDALNLYWDDLVGEKFVLYVPNSGHGLEDRGRGLATAGAFANLVGGDKALPKLNWKHDDADGKARLSITSDPIPSGARLWVAQSATKDFRDAKWHSTPMAGTDGRFIGEVNKPSQGYLALFGEPIYQLDGRTFTLSTQIRIIGPQ